MNPFISYPDLKKIYPIKIRALRHQTDHTPPKKFQFFLENSADPENAKICLIVFRRREIELINDGNKLIERKVL